MNFMGTVNLFELNLANNWVTLWVGWENEGDVWEFRIDLGFRKLWFSLPVIRWLRWEE